MLKKYLFSYLYTFGIMIVSFIVITLLNYFNIINTNTSDTLELISIIISIFIGSFRIGKNSSKKGYLEGINFSIIFILFILILNIIFIGKFDINLIIYYIIILISSIFSSMLGINLNKN